MSRKLFITGTGTEVGKTFVTALIMKKLKDNGKKVAYYKAAASGNQRGKGGRLICGDGQYVKEISGILQPLQEMCPFLYENPYAPHLASRIEENPVSMRTIKMGFDRVCRGYDFVTMEGSGGIVCPLGFDMEKINLEDVIKELNLGCVLVAEAGLGTINSVVLTVEYMKARKILVKGIIFNHFHPGDVLEEDNKYMCEYLTGLKVISCVEENAKELDIEIETLLNLFGE